MAEEAPSVDHDDVVRILGDLDDETVARIVAARPTILDLLEAREWVQQNDGIAERLGHPSSPRVETVVELIQEALDREEGEEEDQEDIGA